MHITATAAHIWFGWSCSSWYKQGNRWCFLYFPLNKGPMFKRKLQVPSSTFALKNPAGDKWAQQPHPAEDSSSHVGSTDAAHAARTQPAACGKGLIKHPNKTICFSWSESILRPVFMCCIVSPSWNDFSRCQHLLFHRDLAQILVSAMVLTSHHWATGWASSQQTTSPAPPS